MNCNKKLNELQSANSQKKNITIIGFTMMYLLL